MNSSNPYASVSTRETPQSQPARTDQVENSAGGYTFEVTPETRLNRFLILGSEAPTYYASSQKLTADNVKALLPLRSVQMVETIRQISEAGRAPKNSPALLLLAACAGADDVETRRAALRVLPRVARTSTHLFEFLTYVQNFRGWGRSLVRAVDDWYANRTDASLALQLVKYRQRDGWSHADVLRLAHKRGARPANMNLYSWARRTDASHPIYDAFIEAQTAPVDRLVELIVEFDLPWECVPDAHLNDPKVLAALLPAMGQTALMRQLPRLTKAGVLDGVAKRLADPNLLEAGRVHPMQVLTALRTYQSGRSLRGSNEWTPNTRIVDALDEAFYASFRNVTPTGKRTLLALDVSGSMFGSNVIGQEGMTAIEAEMAMAMVTMRVEENALAMGFSTSFIPLDLSPRRRLDDIIRDTRRIPFGGTDCALPMTWALQNKLEVDTFIVSTDNETWAGRIHPFEALRAYRERTGIPARLIVCAYSATRFTIADPRDPGMLDVAGLDAAMPNLVASFSRGEF